MDGRAWPLPAISYHERLARVQRLAAVNSPPVPCAKTTIRLVLTHLFGLDEWPRSCYDLRCYGGSAPNSNSTWRGVAPRRRCQLFCDSRPKRRLPVGAFFVGCQTLTSRVDLPGAGCRSI